MCLGVCGEEDGCINILSSKLWSQEFKCLPVCQWDQRCPWHPWQHGSFAERQGFTNRIKVKEKNLNNHLRDSIPLYRDQSLPRQFLFYRALQVFISQGQTILQVNLVYCSKHIFIFLFVYFYLRCKL